MTTENTGPRIPAGDYRVRISGEYAFGHRDDGGDFVGVEIELIDEAWAGMRITYFGNFGDQDVWKGKTPTDFTIESLRAGGFKGDDISDLSSMKGTECTAVIDIDTKGKSRVKRLKNGGVTLKAPLSAAELKVLAARMRQKIGATRATNGGPAAAAPPASGPPAGGQDDIPF